MQEKFGESGAKWGSLQEDWEVAFFFWWGGRESGIGCQMFRCNTLQARPPHTHTHTRTHTRLHIPESCLLTRAAARSLAKGPGRQTGNPYSSTTETITRGGPLPRQSGFTRPPAHRRSPHHMSSVRLNLSILFASLILAWTPITFSSLPGRRLCGLSVFLCCFDLI